MHIYGITSASNNPRIVPQRTSDIMKDQDRYPQSHFMGLTRPYIQLYSFHKTINVPRSKSFIPLEALRLFRLGIALADYPEQQ